MASLYELTGDLARLHDVLVETGGELTPELETALEQAGDAFESKVEGCALVRQELRRASDAAGAEAKRLLELAAGRARAADRLTEYVLHSMEAADVRKVETDRVRVRIQKNGRPSIRWSGDGDPPAEFAKVETRFDGVAAYDAYLGGRELPDGVVVEHGRHLRVQ